MPAALEDIGNLIQLTMVARIARLTIFLREIFVAVSGPRAPAP